MERAYTDLRGKGALNLPPGSESSYPAFTLRHRLADEGLVPLRRLRSPCVCVLADVARCAALKDLRPDAVELYAGGGGGALGLSAHFTLALAVDSDEHCAATLRANFPSTQVMQRRVAELPAIDRPALLSAGPPCQGFTRLNPARGDRRNAEMGQLVAAVARVRPPLVLVENVPGFADCKDADGVQWNAAHDVIHSLLGLGYQVRAGVLDAASFGAPQYRRRVFVLAARRGTALPAFPRPSHANARAPRSVPRFLAGARDDGTAPFPPLTAEMAVGDLPRWSYDSSGPGTLYPFQTEAGFRRCTTGAPRSRYAARLQNAARARDHVTTGCTLAEYQRILDAGPPGNSGVQQRAPPDQPVNTQLGTCRIGGKSTNPLHWSDDRQFTLLERRRFQGFPDAYKLRGPIEAREQMIGNAVHCELMAAIAAQIKRDAFREFVAT